MFGFLFFGFGMARPNKFGSKLINLKKLWSKFGTRVDKLDQIDRTKNGLFTIKPVEHCDSRITNEDDESGSWTEVVSKKKKKTDVSMKKKPYVLLTTNLGGKQSECLDKLTLFTKSN